MIGTPMTETGYAKLEAELARLHAERETIVERIGQALARGGGLPENGDYLDARHEQDLLERRIAQLEERLQAAEIVEPVLDGEVDIGERVRVVDLESGATADYRIVGSGEADPAAGEISHESPMGAALLGRRAGDVVEVEVPTRTVRLEVVDVEG